MAMRDPIARKLLAASELSIYENSRGTALNALSPALIAQKVRRARSLRDKYQDRGKQQAREARGKAAARGKQAASGNDRTVAKAQLMNEILDRYLARQEKLRLMQEKKDALAAKAADKKATQLASKAPTKKVSGKSAAAAKTPAKKACGTRCKPKKTAKKGKKV